MYFFTDSNFYLKNANGFLHHISNALKIIFNLHVNGAQNLFSDEACFAIFEGFKVQCIVNGQR